MTTMEHTSIDIEHDAVIYKLKNKEGIIVFLVELLHKNCGEEPKIIVKVREISRRGIPFDVVRTEYCVHDKRKAVENFHKLISDYRTLISTFDHYEATPEKVFKDAVNYHVTCPECCLNCEHSAFGKNGKKQNTCFQLECFNRLNLKQYQEIDREFSQKGSFHRVESVPVDEKGKCNNYMREKRRKEIFPRRDIKDYLMMDHDLVDLIKTIQENRLVEFEDEIYVKNGKQNPKFVENVLSVVNDLEPDPQCDTSIENDFSMFLDFEKLK